MKKFRTQLFLFLFIFLTGAFSSLSTYAQDRRLQIINIINQEIVEVQRITEQTTGINPTFELKKAELFLEKGRLERELENERYLKISPRRRNQRVKREVFRQSEQSYAMAKNICQKIVRDSPSYRNIGDVYYILAYYAKEKGDNAQALKNFNLARRVSRDPKLVKRAEIAMADMFYTQNKCPQAIELYRKAIPRVDDKWKTKDLYNYGWCLYKTNRADAAIRALNESYRLSQNSKYIDMSGRVQKDMMVFFVYANRYDDAIRFISQNSDSKKEAVDQLIKRVSDGGKETQAVNLLNKIIANTSSKSERLYYYQKLYKIYEMTSWSAATQVVPIIKKSFSSVTHQEKQQLKKKAIQFIDYIQDILLNNKIDNSSTKSSMAQAAYKHGSLLEQGSQAKMKIDLVLAEIFQLTGQNKSSFDMYMKSYAQSKKTSDLIKEASLEGALQVVSRQNLKDLELIYRAYLVDSNKYNKKPPVFEKLFQVYMRKREYKKAQGVLQLYQKQYPQKIKKQESMLAQLFEVYEKTKDDKNARALLTLVQSGQFQTGALYRNKLNLLSNNLLQKSATQALQLGKWQDAVGNYKKAYQANQDRGVKAKTALNISTIYSQNKKIPDSIIWLENSIKLMSGNSIVNSTSSINKQTSQIFYQGYMNKAYNIQKQAWLKACSSQALFENLFIMTRALKTSSQATDLLLQAQKCQSLKPKIIPLARTYSKDLYRSGEIKSYNKLYQYFKGVPQFEADNRSQIKRLEDLRKVIATSVLSSNPQRLGTQIQNILNRLTKMNSLIGSIPDNSFFKIQGYDIALKSYRSAGSIIKRFLHKNNNADLSKALNPVSQTISIQETATWRKTLQTIEKTPNYSLANQSLLSLIKGLESRRLIKENP